MSESPNETDKAKLLGVAMQQRPYNDLVALTELIAAGKCPKTLNTAELSKLLEMGRDDAFISLKLSTGKTLSYESEARTYSPTEEAEEIAKKALGIYYRERLIPVLEGMTMLDPDTRTAAISEITDSLTEERYVEERVSKAKRYDDENSKEEGGDWSERVRIEREEKLTQITLILKELGEKLSE